MQTRTLGPEQFQTSAIGFGCMGLSQGYGETVDSRSTATIHAALDAGITGFDTAMSYGGGHNERLVGAALAGSGLPRDRFQISTKFGIVRGPDGVHLDARPDRVAAWCDDSLRRLGMDHIDLFYLHRVDPAVPIEESVGAMAELVTAGKVRHLGISEVTPEQLERAHGMHPITAVQLEWSLMWREPEARIVPTARRLGVGLVPYSPLGRGLLGGGLDATSAAESPFRASDPRFHDAALHANLQQAQALTALANEWDTTPAEVALAWLLAQGDDVAPIPGSRRPERARQNAAAADLTLDAHRLAAIDALTWTGDRMSFAVPVTARPAACPHR